MGIFNSTPESVENKKENTVATIEKVEQSHQLVPKHFKNHKTQSFTKVITKEIIISEEKVNNESKEILEIGLLCDCTSSMSAWIERAKQTLNSICKEAVESCDGKIKVRVSFIGYRDHKDKKRFAVKNFTEDIDEIKKWINGVKAQGGGDIPEDVTGGMKKCLEQYWKKNSTKQVFHILDAPCHGSQYHNDKLMRDDYPNGCPEGLIIEDLMKEFKKKHIGYTCIKLNDSCDLMFDKMKQVYKQIEITDLSNDIKIKTPEEVTQKFQKKITKTVIKRIFYQQTFNEQKGIGKLVLNKQRIEKILQKDQKK